MTSDPSPDRYLPLAPHDFQVLLSLLDRDLHGYALIKDIEDRTDGETVLGTSTLYAALKRMEEGGLLEEAPGPGRQTSGGPRRRYYRITELGREVARAEGLRIRRLDRMVGESSLLDGPGAVVAREVEP
jgi:DNA-binding PadR family transcriptional regulator